MWRMTRYLAPDDSWDDRLNTKLTEIAASKRTPQSWNDRLPQKSQDHCWLHKLHHIAILAVIQLWVLNPGTVITLSLANITSYDLHQCRLFDTTATNRCHHRCCIQYYWQVTVLRILLQNLLGMLLESTYNCHFHCWRNIIVITWCHHWVITWKSSSSSSLLLGWRLLGKSTSATCCSTGARPQLRWLSPLLLLRMITAADPEQN